jgi:hypothetical protein
MVPVFLFELVEVFVAMAVLFEMSWGSVGR